MSTVLHIRIYTVTNCHKSAKQIFSRKYGISSKGISGDVSVLHLAARNILAWQCGHGCSVRRCRRQRWRLLPCAIRRGRGASSIRWLAVRAFRWQSLVRRSSGCRRSGCRCSGLWTKYLLRGTEQQLCCNCLSSYIHKMRRRFPSTINLIRCEKKPSEAIRKTPLAVSRHH